MPVTTGAETLDEILNGGLPAGRTVLLTGTPGSGKSTLAMQFLQQGLTEGDECLYISTEQTGAEIRDSFAPFDFGLDHENLSVTSLHIRPGRGVEHLLESGDVTRSIGDEGSRSGFVMRTLEGDDFLDQQQVEYTAANLYQYLKHRIDHVDRVVLDSASGLRPIAADETAYRRVILDLVQLFNAELDATAVFTAESRGGGATREGVEQLTPDEAVQFNLHGVIRLWRENVRGAYRRFLDVMKMRGVAHDTRRFEVTFTDDGLRIVPQRRVGKHSPFQPDHLPTRIDGLDAMLGGGLPRGRSTLLQHDGQANIESFLYALASKALDQRMSQVIVPRVDTPQRFLDALFDQLDVSMDTLLERNQLFVVDVIGSWDERENVLSAPTTEEMESALTGIRQQARGEGILFSVNTEALVHTYGAEESRAFRYWLQAQAVGEQDVLLDIHNPAVMRTDLSSFYIDAAEQVIDTWLTEAGLQYVQLRKGRQGDVGSLRLVEYTAEPPYIRAVR